MLIGHLAVAFAAKRLQPNTSLGTFVAAALLSDLLWTLFLVAGLEHVRIISRGPTLMTSIGIYDIGWSHSLATTALWAALAAGIYFLRAPDVRAPWVLFAAAISHWPLDWISHTPDMPLAPGIPYVYGLGLWTSIPATLVVEGGCWVLAIALYVRATRPKSRAGVYGLWIGVALLTLAWYGNVAGPPPANTDAIGVQSGVFFLLVCGWAYWINRCRAEPSRLGRDTT